jgi:predicted nucleotidyltransferase
MKTDLDHLPAHKRDLITAIAGLVQGGAPVEMLILFGSYARGDWVEDPVGGYVSDLDVRSVSHKWQCQGLGTGMRKEGKEASLIT